MNIIELIDYLEQIRESEGNLPVRATNHGYCPPEIAIKVNCGRVVLEGCHGLDYVYDKDGVVNNEEELR